MVQWLNRASDGAEARGHLRLTRRKDQRISREGYHPTSMRPVEEINVRRRQRAGEERLARAQRLGSAFDRAIGRRVNLARLSPRALLPQARIWFGTVPQAIDLIW